MVHNALLEGDL